MKKPAFKYIFLSLFIVLLNTGAPLGHGQGLQTANNETLQARSFAPGKLEEHYLKHGYQFGHISKEQYLQGARELLDSPPGGDILEKVRTNGDVEHFRVSTGEFAVMTRRGRIRTYYITDYNYWLRH